MAFREQDLLVQTYADAKFHLSVAEASHNLIYLHLMKSLFAVLEQNMKSSMRCMFKNQMTREPLLCKSQNDDMTDITHILNFLACETPQAWIEDAINNQSMLLIDHANCEKKAASTAINLMYRYVENYELLNKMSRLAREELRHFEQVIAIMKKRGIDYPQVDAARYAGQLRKKIRTSEPGKLIDTLIVGAIIEARSCERFAKLAPYLDDELGGFYRSLLKSEARHYQDYLNLARKASDQSIDERIGAFLAYEKELIESVDKQFRFHSGPLGN